jgi:hypothetical protein
LWERLQKQSTEGYADEMKERPVPSFAVAFYFIAIGLWSEELGSLSAGAQA